MGNDIAELDPSAVSYTDQINLADLPDMKGEVYYRVEALESGSNPIGIKVTLRSKRMWDFLDRLMNISLARQRDFRGVSPDSFDCRGNYTLGLAEQLFWPEINYYKIDKVRGMEISIVTTAKTDEEGRRLLELLGMPLRR